MTTTRAQPGLAGLALLLVPALAGCGGGTPVPPPPAPAATTPAQATEPSADADAPPATDAETWKGSLSNAGTFYLEYRTEPDPPPLNRAFTVHLRLFDAADRSTPLAYDDLVIDARMPHHRHGMNLDPVVSESGPAQLQVADMLFHMPGYWEVHVDVQRGDDVERAQFAVLLK